MLLNMLAVGGEAATATLISCSNLFALGEAVSNVPTVGAKHA